MLVLQNMVPRAAIYPDVGSYITTKVFLHLRRGPGSSDLEFADFGSLTGSPRICRVPLSVAQSQEKSGD